MNRLIGKTIFSISVGPEKEWIEFIITDGEKFHYDAFGDCCSSSWIESIEDIDNLIGETVISVDAKHIRRGEEGTYECLEVMNYDINTSKGACTIDFRNASNGYYGGYLEFIESQSITKQGG